MQSAGREMGPPIPPYTQLYPIGTTLPATKPNQANVGVMGLLPHAAMKAFRAAPVMPMNTGHRPAFTAHRLGRTSTL